MSDEGYTIEACAGGFWIYRGDDALYGWSARDPEDAAIVLLNGSAIGRAAWVLAPVLVRELELDQIPRGERRKVPDRQIRQFLTRAGLAPLEATP